MGNNEIPLERVTKAHDVKLGSITVLAGGVTSFISGLLVFKVCCWAPALIVALGVGSFYGAVYGYRYWLMGLGALLLGIGLFSLWRRSQSQDCPCGTRGEVDISADGMPGVKAKPAPKQA